MTVIKQIKSNKKLNVLLVCLFALFLQIKAQTDAGCTSPPNCIQNPDMEVSAGSPIAGDLSPNGSVKCDSWYVAYGTPTRFGGDSAIWMWSYYGATSGEGIYTCFNFQQGHTYKVCFYTRTTDIPSAFGYANGTFYVQATNGNFTRPANTASQVIASWHMVDQSFTSYCFTFTANNNYSRLWFFPFMASAPAVGVGGQYEAEVKHVNVEEISGNTPSINVSADTISITNSPITPGHWSWSPSSFILYSNADSSQVITNVCSQTIFTARYISNCHINSVYLLTDTVQGHKPSIKISGSDTTCVNQSITLTASGANTYLWQPDNLSGASITISPTSNITYTVTGTINNCVSTADYNITVYKNYSHIDSVTICNGKSYSLPDGNIKTSAGVYTSILKTINGCDSIITTHLYVKPFYIDTISAFICNGETYLLPDGNSATATGLYTDTLQSVNGYDSIITIDLNVFNVYSIHIYDTICNDKPYLLPNGTGVTSSGIYICRLTSRNGCDSIITIHLVVINLTANASQTNVLCYGENNGSITVSASGGIAPLQYIWNGVNTSDSHRSNLIAGNYEITIVDANGCTAKLNVAIIQPNNLIVSNSLASTEINLGDTISINLTTNYNYASFSWHPLAGLSCSDCPSPKIFPSVSTDYNVTVTISPDNKTCVYSIKIPVTVNSFDQLFIPEAFSPNSDGINDVLFVRGHIKTIKFEIYNQWGFRVFLSDHPSVGWDGKYDAHEQPEGNYLWILDATTLNDKQIKRQGIVSLIR